MSTTLKKEVLERIRGGNDPVDIHEELIANGYGDAEVRGALMSARRLSFKIEGCVRLGMGLALLGVAVGSIEILRTEGLVPSGLIGVGTLFAFFGVVKLIAGFVASDGVRRSAGRRHLSGLSSQEKIDWVYGVLRGQAEMVCRNLGRALVAMMSISAAGFLLNAVMPGVLAIQLVAFVPLLFIPVPMLVWISARRNLVRWRIIEKSSGLAPAQVVGIEVSEIEQPFSGARLTRLKLTVMDPKMKTRTWRAVLVGVVKSDIGSALATAFPEARCEVSE